jgi:hypothetical protein
VDPAGRSGVRSASSGNRRLADGDVLAQHLPSYGPTSIRELEAVMAKKKSKTRSRTRKAKDLTPGTPGP